jgi:hypothetical protein
MDADQHEFPAKAFGITLDRVFRRRIRADEGRRELAGDRAYVDDAPLGAGQVRICAQQWREGAYDRKHANQVGFDLCTEIGDALHK